MKRFFKLVGIAILTIMGLLLIIVLIAGLFFVNRENPEYKGSFNYTDGKSLLEKINEHNESAIVIVASPNCSGVPEFMPEIEKQQILLREKNIPVFFVIDMLNKAEDYERLESVLKDYSINYYPLIIDPIKHPSGNLFNAARKYDSFLTQLCGTCNDGSLGYPFYVYYKRGKYIGHSYYLNDSLLAALN